MTGFTNRRLVVALCVSHHVFHSPTLAAAFIVNPRAALAVDALDGSHRAHPEWQGPAPHLALAVPGPRANAHASRAAHALRSHRDRIEIQ